MSDERTLTQPIQRYPTIDSKNMNIPVKKLKKQSLKKVKKIWRPLKKETMGTVNITCCQGTVY